MAADIDKGLYQAPLGMEELENELGEPEIEIEIVDPEEVTIKAGGLEIEIDPDDMENEAFNANLAEEMDDSLLEQLASDLLGDYE